MNKLHQKVFKNAVLCCCLFAMAGYGQTQSKNYKESFSVGDEAVVDINTSHADIEFETWNKNQVIIEPDKRLINLLTNHKRRSQ